MESTTVADAIAAASAATTMSSDAPYGSSTECMNDVRWLQQRLNEEQAQAAELRQGLEEAACVGQQLLSINEELQQEVDQLQHAARALSRASPRFPCAPRLGVISPAALDSARTPAGSTRTPRMAFGRSPRAMRQLELSVVSPAALTVDSARTPCMMAARARRHSVHVLAKEYDHELQELAAENRTLEMKAQQLQRDNQELKDCVQKSGLDHVQSGFRLWSPPQSKAVTPTVGNGVPGRLAVQGDASSPTSSSSSDTSPGARAAFEAREELLKSEFDDERARSWELQQELDRTRQECTELGGHVEALSDELHQQQVLREASETGAAQLRQQFVEMMEASQAAQAEMPEKASSISCWHSSESAGAGSSLLRDLQASEVWQDELEADVCSPRPLELSKHVAVLRDQLLNAELEAQRHHAERRGFRRAENENRTGNVDAAAATEEKQRRRLASKASTLRPVARSKIAGVAPGSPGLPARRGSIDSRLSLLRASWPDAFRAR